MPVLKRRRRQARSESATEQFRDASEPLQKQTIRDLSRLGDQVIEEIADRATYTESIVRGVLAATQSYFDETDRPTGANREKEPGTDAD